MSRDDVQATEGAPQTTPAKSDPQTLPPWKVLLHNDDVNTIDHVWRSVVQVTPLDGEEADDRVREAHREGLSLLLTAHQERAELYQEQLTSKGLCVTIEPDEK